MYKTNKQKNDTKQELKFVTKLFGIGRIKVDLD